MSSIESSGREQHEPFRRGNPTHQGHAAIIKDQVNALTRGGPVERGRETARSKLARQFAGFQFKH